MRQLVIPILSLLFLVVGCSTESTPVYLLTASVTPEETGTVSPASGEFDEGTEVQIQAQPSEGYYFSRWNGDLSGSENPHTFTINADTDVTAVFERIEYSLNIDIEGEGTVQEEVLPAKSKDYPEGTVVQLEALPDDGWAFLEWQGDLEGEENPATINVDQEKNVTAVFERAYSLSTTVIPDGVGSVEPSEGSFIAETTLEVEAVSTNSGWKFDRWQGDFSGTMNPFNLTMNGDKTLEAHFERRQFNLELTSEGEGSLSTDLMSGTQTEDGYLYESEVEITATPDDEWNFLRWEGDVESTDNPLEITIEEDISIHAVFSHFVGGDGSSTNPYQIATIQQLQKMELYLDRHFILISDIDASETSGWNGGKGFEPIGDESDPFTGSLDGSGFKISGLTIDRQDEDYVGLFGYADGIQINNIGLVNISVSGNTWVGGLIGRSIGSGEVNDSHVTGEVSGDTRIGGLIGRNEGEINDSFANSDVSATDRSVGGLVGSNRGQISGSHATGKISGDSRVGGLSGSNFVPNGSGGVINDSYATGDVSGDSRVGGLVGRNNEGDISDSYATGNVSGYSYIGGLVGHNVDGKINRSNATGGVSGVADSSSWTGGLVGYNRHGGRIIDSHASGNVSTQGRIVGGLVGINWGIINNSYATGEVKGGGHGFPESEVVGGLVGSNRGEINASYATGKVSGEDDVGGLVSSNGGQIIDSYATGEVSAQDYTGGGLVSHNSGQISGSHATGNVSVFAFPAGGLVASNSGEISNSYAHGNVEGKSEVGGLVGRNNNTVTMSYSKGIVTGDTEVGGLIGVNNSTIESSYWDTESSEQNDGVGSGSSSGATGLTTSEMTDDEAEDNMPEFDWEDIWRTTSEYPELRWQE